MENQSNRIRVLMIGPGEGIEGGITTLVETFLPVLRKKVSIYYLHSVSQRPMKDSGKFTIGNIWLAISQYARFLNTLIRFKPYIIHIHSSQGIAWLKDTFFVICGKIFHCHIALHMHGGNFDKIYQQNHRFIQAYTRKVLSLSDIVISVSDEWTKRFTRIMPVNCVVTLKNCIDVQNLHPSLSSSSADKIDILFLGRLGKLKGVYDLVEAIHLISSKEKNMRVWLVGSEQEDGDYKKIRDFLEAYHLIDIIKLVGEVSREDAFVYLQSADLFVLPSYYECLPMAILEALAAGLPVIATSIGGIPEVVRDGFNGFLVLPGDIEALAEKLSILVEDPALRKTMGQRSREISERELDVNPYVDRLVELYSSLCC